MAAAAPLKYPELTWVDGTLVSHAKVSIFTHSLHYGMGAFEGIRAYRQTNGGTSVFRLREHVRRLFESAQLCMMEMPCSEDDVAQACLDVVRANNMSEAYLRPLVFFGDEAMGLGAVPRTHVAVACWVWGAYLGEEGLRRGIRAKIASFPRMSSVAFLTRGKITGQYVNSILAKREAVLAGYDEAILLNAAGNVAEASGENIFLIRGGKILTPPLSAGILAGITRDSLMRIARDKGLKVEEQLFNRDELYLADEVFLCGTAAEVTPVREVDNRRIGSGAAGPITLALQETFFRITRGEDSAYRAWLTPLDASQHPTVAASSS